MSKATMTEATWQVVEKEMVDFSKKGRGAIYEVAVRIFCLNEDDEYKIAKEAAGIDWLKELDQYAMGVGLCLDAVVVMCNFTQDKKEWTSYGINQLKARAYKESDKAKKAQGETTNGESNVNGRKSEDKLSWKDKYMELEKEVVVLRAEVKTLTKENSKLIKELSKK